MPRGRNIPRFRRRTLTRGIKIELRPGETVEEALIRMRNRGLASNPRKFSLQGQGKNRKNKKGKNRE